MEYKTSEIKAEMRKTVYAAQEHLAIVINDELLDVIIDEEYPEENFLGLIPTLLPVIPSREEQDLVWERFKPEPGKPKMVPVLMCPEDLDLSCTTLIIKVIDFGEYIIWEKFGMDISGANGYPQSLGSRVEWLKKIKPMYFKKEQYMEMLEAFRQLQ
ncbi:MAG TPA: hypothetical protein VEC12_14760 [Bacteroidia bacterium]|nr:hypothetical protein [Bacteroidia bacterium]